MSSTKLVLWYTIADESSDNRWQIEHKRSDSSNDRHWELLGFGNIPTVIINGASDKLRQVHILYNLIEDSNIAKFRQYMCKNMLHNPLSYHYCLDCESGISL